MTLREARRMFRWFFRRDAVRRALDDEIDAHIDLATQTYTERGMSPSEARAQAEREFGGRLSTREATGDVHALRLGMAFDGWLHDLRIAMRSLTHARGFSIAVIGIFSIAIAANATSVGLVDRLLLRPPGGVSGADKLVRLYVSNPDRRSGVLSRGISYLRYAELRDAASPQVDLALMSTVNIVIGEGMTTQRARGQMVSANYFDILGVQPARGRFFTAAEATPPTGEDVMVLSDAMWKRGFGGASDVIGTRVRFGPRLFTIIGIAPPDFTNVDLDRIDVWVPATAILATYPQMSPTWYREHNFTWAEAIGRLRPGVTREAARAALHRAYLASFERAKRPATPSTAALSLAPIQLERGPNRTDTGKVAGWLAGVALIMLLIAAANVANLFLTRGINRRRELSVRLALGVSRTRLVLQLLTESMILAIASAVIAVVLTWWASNTAVVLIEPTANALGLIDARLMLLTFVVTTVAALAGSVVPVIRTTRVDLVESMRAGARTGVYQRVGLRSALLVTQAALSVVLLVGAGLFVRSLDKARHARIGFDADHLLTVSISARGERLPDGIDALYLQLKERLAGIPNVTSVSRGMSLPFGAGYQSDFAIPGIDSVWTHGDVYYSAVDATYFDVLGTRIVAGRGFLPTDVAGAPLVAVVSESMSKTFWPATGALGQCIHIGGDSLPCSTVVGIAENTHRGGVRPESSHNYYVSAVQGHPQQDISALVARVKGGESQMAAVIRSELQRMVPGAVFVRVGSMRERLEPTLRPWKLGAFAFVILGGLALVTAAMGLFSVIGNAIAQRRHEFGVRLALGAQGRDVVRVALREGLPGVAIGSAIGLAVSAFAVRWVGALLFGVEPRDPVVFAGVAIVLGVTALVASIIPALRALRINPLIALRSD